MNTSGRNLLNTVLVVALSGGAAMTSVASPAIGPENEHPKSALLVTSLADSGNDQRGFHRVYDVPAIPNVSDACDIGAYEFGSSSLPAPWLTVDVGAVGMPGAASESNGVFSVFGSGADIWGPSDQFRFVYLPLIGDGTIIARVVSVGNTDPFAKAGVMFRQSLDPGSVNAAVVVSFAHGTGLTYRNAPNGTTLIQSTAQGAPYWVKITRVGRKFTGFSSADGVTWNQIAQPDMVMSDPVLVGLCVTAHNNDALNLSTFDNVTLIGNTNVPPPPPPLPPPWTNSDVGTVGLAGTSSFTNGVWTVAGSGTDIWGSRDAFQYTWQQWSGDGTIIARVASVGNTDPWAKAGVMFRQSLDPGSVNATVLVSAANGTGLTYRNLADGTTFIGSAPRTAPYWVRITRTGSKFTGYTSADGVTWNRVAEPDIAMSDPVLVGLCVTAHNNSALNVSTFDNVTVTTNVPPPPPPPPSFLPPPWTNSDVGPVGLSGSASFTNGVWTVVGSGVDIWGPQDSFQYVWQRWSGDGAIIARVASVGNTDPWAKAGVMFRQSLDAGSVNTAVIVTSANGTGLTYRNMVNGTTFINSGPQGAPYWVKIVRTGRKFTGFTSADGVTWNQVAQPDIGMSDPIYVGLCVTAHNNSLLNTSILDHVTLAQTNSWTSPVTGLWHDLTWSLGVLPNINQPAIEVTNAGQKLVILNQVTRDSFPESMVISNLTVAGTPSSTNTVLLNTGTQVPFRIFNSLVLGTNGVLDNQQSALEMAGSSSTLLVDGGLLVEFGGRLLADAIEVFSGRFSQELGTVTANSLTLDDSGTYVQLSGSLVIVGPRGTRLGVSAPGAFFRQSGGTHQTPFLGIAAEGPRLPAGYELDNGILLSQETRIRAPGAFTQQDGTNYTEQLFVLGAYDLEDGHLVTSNTIVNSTIAGSLAEFQQNGGVHLTKKLTISGVSGALTSARYFLNGGSLITEGIEVNGEGTETGFSFLSHGGGLLTNSGQFIFSGGNLLSAGTNGQLGSLLLLSNSFIMLGPTTRVIEHFAASAQNSWNTSPGVFLNIVNWQGSTTGGGLHQIYVGNSRAALTGAQLAQIRFIDALGHTSPADILDTGELVPMSLPTLEAVREPDGLVLSWPDNWVLQSATNVSGPYLDMEGVTSPCTNAFTGECRFFRLRR